MKNTVGFILLASMSLACAPRKYENSGEAKNIFGGSLKDLWTDVMQPVSASGEFLLRTNHDNRSQGVVTPGIWFCADFNIGRNRSSFEEPNAKVYCHNNEKEMASRMPQKTRITHSISEIACRQESDKSNVSCTVLRRIPVPTNFLSPNLVSTVTLKGFAWYGTSQHGEFDSWSSNPPFTMKDTGFCERYVKNDKGQDVEIDNKRKNDGLFGTQTARCWGSREALIKNLNLDFVKRVGTKVDVNGVQEIVFGDMMFVGFNGLDVVIEPLQARLEELNAN